MISKREDNEMCESPEYLVRSYYVPVIELNAEILNQINWILLMSHPERTASLDSCLDP